MRKWEITVPGGPIYVRMALAAGLVDPEESIRQDKSRYQREQVSQPSKLQVNHNQSNHRKHCRGSLQGRRSLRRGVWDWDARNLQIETQVAKVQRASHGWFRVICLFLSQLNPRIIPESLSSEGLRQETVSSGRKSSKPSVPRPKHYLIVSGREPST